MSLKVEGLTRQYPGNPKPTLQGLSFDLPKGTLTAMLGRSGAGKSTMLRCVVGLEPFERGTLQIEGVTVRGTDEVSAQQRAEQLRAARAKLGLVFQSFELFPHLTALQNCTLAPVQVKGLSEAAAEATAKELLSQLGLGERMNHFPDQLSGGQKQRVAIARALAMDPAVLLYDEPTSALDPSLKAEVISSLKRIDERHVTQVVVTHDLQLARAVEHVCVLDQGIVIESGPPSKVLVNPDHESTRTLLQAWLAEG
ncbi:MAG: amino acid ABC transporter ATP-binding protein [Myxococcaceae bacterium]|nr:amino acid ABC transporter ATP-binding protein [Myxococcaceae bacterium]